MHQGNRHQLSVTIIGRFYNEDRFRRSDRIWYCDKSLSREWEGTTLDCSPTQPVQPNRWCPLSLPHTPILLGGHLAGNNHGTELVSLPWLLCRSADIRQGGFVHPVPEVAREGESMLETCHSPVLCVLAEYRAYVVALHC